MRRALIEDLLAMTATTNGPNHAGSVRGSSPLSSTSWWIVRPGSETASPPRKRDRTPDDQTPVVPRVCQDGQAQPDNPWTEDTNQPLNWVFQDAMAPCETRWTVGLGFTHQRAAVRYRPRPLALTDVKPYRQRMLTLRRESNALTSLAGQTYHPRDGWRWPG